MPNEVERPRLAAMARAVACTLILMGGVPGLIDAGPRSPTVTRARYLMGTIFRFEAHEVKSPSHTAAALEEALEEVSRLENVLSNWRSESEISRLNARAGKGAAEASQTLFAAVSSSVTWARETGGAFDPTVEPLTRRFRTGGLHADPVAQEPSPGAIPAAGGWMQVRLDSSAHTVTLPAGVGLDMGGIGKGMALDLAARVLLGRGIHAALLDAGGQLLALGSPPGEMGWTVSIADPASRQRATFPLILRDVSLATSGNSERPGEILDPGTGKPILGRYSATALALDATSADALSTALFVMGPLRGEAWAKPRSDLLAVFLEPAEEADSPPRAIGTLRPAPPGHVLFITARHQDGHPGSLHVEIR